MSADKRVINNDDPDDGRMFGHETPDEGDINSELMPDGANTEKQQAIAKTAIVNRKCPGKYLTGLIAENHFQDEPWNAPAEGTISKYLSEFNLREGRDRADDPANRAKWADAREATERVKMVKDYQRKGKHEQPYLLTADEDELTAFIDKTAMSTRFIAQLDPKDSVEDYVKRRAEEMAAVDDDSDDSVDHIETENGNASFSGEPIDDRMQHVAERPNQGSDPEGQADETTEESPSSDDSMETPLDVMGGASDGYADLDTVGVGQSRAEEQSADHDDRSHEITVYDDEIVDVISALLDSDDVPDGVAKRAIKNV